MIGNIVAARPSWHPALGAGPVQSLVTAAPGIAASTAAAANLLTAPLNVILPGVGIVLGAIIGSLFAAHAARVAGAKQENQVLNSLIPTVQQAVSTVFQHLNDGTASASAATSALDQIQQQYWQAVAQIEHNAGQAGGPGNCSTRYGDSKGDIGAPCNKDCTASCCIGCGWVENWVDQGKKIIASGSGSRSWPAIPGNSYGLQSFPGLAISYTAPAPGTAAAATAALTSGEASGLLSGSVLGIPVWMIIAGLVAWKVL